MKGLFAVGAVVAVTVAGCSADQGRFETYTGDGGTVWIETDCPNADQLLSGSPDGLPMKGQTDLEQVEAAVGSNERASVVPRNGDVWEEAEDGTIVVTRVQDYMIQITLDDTSECPTAPASSNGIPLVYRIAD
jgi:hypothetical protein